MQADSTFEAMHTRQLRPEVEAAKMQSKGWLRTAYFVRSLIYAASAFIAIDAVVSGQDLEVTAQHGLAVSQHSWTLPLLCVAGAALGACALLRLAQAALDPEGRGLGALAIARRVGVFVNAVMYAALAFIAAEMAFGEPVDAHGDPQSFVGVTMSVPFCQFLVALLGVVLVAAGGGYVYYAQKRRFSGDLDLSDVAAPIRSRALQLGQVALTCWGVALAIMGAYMAKAGATANPGEITGLGQALVEVARGPVGAIALLMVSAGLLGYSAYQALRGSCYRQS